MADLPSSFSNVNDTEMRQDTINSESQYSKLGSNDNYLKDTLDTNIAARISGDSNLQTQINTIETAVNTLIQIPQLVHQVLLGPFYYNSPNNSAVPWGQANPIPLTRTQVVPAFFAYCFNSPSLDTNTYIFPCIFWDGGDDVVYRTTQINAGVSRSAWDFPTFNIENGIYMRVKFYKLVTLSV